MADLVTAIEARLSDLENQHNTLALEVERLIEALEEKLDDQDLKIGRIMQRLEYVALNIPLKPIWVPYDAGIDDPPENAGARVVVLTRAGDTIGARYVSEVDWSQCGDSTVVAWCYARHG